MDHGLLNLPLNKRGAGSLDAQIDRNLKRMKSEQEDERAHTIAAYLESIKPVPFTREELESAEAVRTHLGWHKVIKVNAKSVTVETNYSWNDRYPLYKILEVRA